MLITLCTAVLVAAPQGESRPSSPARNPAEVKRVRVDSRGWPVLRGASRDGEAASDFRDVPAAPPGAAAGPEPEVELRPARPAPVLAEVFARIGAPEQLRELECVVARLRLHVFDHRGGEIAMREVFLESDLRVAARDRLVFPDEKLIYGRDAAAVWAERHGMVWASLERSARGQLGVVGTLLRSPWVFADSRQWTVFPGETAQLDGQSMWHVRVERARSDETIGPVPARDVDRYELFCDLATREPRVVRFRLAGGAGKRRVDLLGYQTLGEVRIPTRLVFRRPSGHKAMEIEVVRIDGRQKLPREQFQPPVR